LGEKKERKQGLVNRGKIRSSLKTKEGKGENHAPSSEKGEDENVPKSEGEGVQLLKVGPGGVKKREMMTCLKSSLQEGKTKTSSTKRKLKEGCGEKPEKPMQQPRQDARAKR